MKTAAGRVFYGGGGITPDIEVKPLSFTPVRNRIAEAAISVYAATGGGTGSGS